MVPMACIRKDDRMSELTRKNSQDLSTSVPDAPVSVAVMPFENLSGSREDDYFSIGFVEDLTADLAHFSSLQVFSAYTTRKMAQAGDEALAVAADLGIGYLLNGSLRRLKTQIRITAKLMETTGGRVLWGERYDAPLDTLFDIQDDMVARVVGAISVRIDRALLAAARRKPITSMAAYDLWLHGMDRLRRGTPAADREARAMFKQALAVDPHYSRAYAGLSLSHFNDWSCQFWGQWEATERKAYDYALKAFRLDDTDHVVQMILGRILLFRRQFDLATQHLDNALMLNANDADNLVQIAACMAWLGDAKRGEKLFLKGLRLNPYRDNWYYTYGAVTYFSQRRFATFIDTARKGPLTEVWIDQPAYLAAACAHLGDNDSARDYLRIFKDAFGRHIMADRRSRADEIVAWLTQANPFRQAADLAVLIDGLALAGLGRDAGARIVAPPGQPSREHPTLANVFRQAGALWRMTYDGMSVQLPALKGFADLAVLLARPGIEVHCSELMGRPVRVEDREEVIDGKARQAYETRIRDLQAAIAEAEAMNDPGRRASAEAELDQLTDHLARALGLGGRPRTVRTPVDRARSAVTWRIRSAIRKIESVHPTLAKHLAHSINTGTFCRYTPETPHTWEI